LKNAILRALKPRFQDGIAAVFEISSSSPSHAVSVF